jgi:hypothetical protein
MRKGQDFAYEKQNIFIVIGDRYSLTDNNVINYIDCINPTEFEIKDTTYKARSASYLDIHK